MNNKRTTRPKAAKAAREAFFVRVEAGDGGVAFFNASEHIGRPFPFKDPKATCAMRVTDTAVTFSLLHLTKKTAPTIVGKDVVLPRGPLARLERRAASLELLAPGEILVELSTPLPYEADTAASAEPAPAPAPAAAVGLDDLFDEAPAATPAVVVDVPAVSTDGLDDLFADAAPAVEAPAVEAPDAAPAVEAPAVAVATSAAPRHRPARPMKVETFTCTLSRDEHGIGSIATEGDEHTFELPRSAVRVGLFMRSPIADRTGTHRILAIGFIGYFGKSGTNETVSRVTAMVLNSLLGLAEFRILSQLETVVVPAGVGRAPRARPALRAEERAEFVVRLHLFTDDLAPVATGQVLVSFDLEHANPTSGHLMTSFTPEDSIVAVFDNYRMALESAVAHALRVQLGDEQIQAITYDIVLGTVDSGTVERLREVGTTIAALDMTPVKFQQHQDA